LRKRSATIFGNDAGICFQRGEGIAALPATAALGKNASRDTDIESPTCCSLLDKPFPGRYRPASAGYAFLVAIFLAEATEAGAAFFLAVSGFFLSLVLFIGVFDMAILPWFSRANTFTILWLFGIEIRFTAYRAAFALRRRT
jgi:hypothetical protein